MRGEKDEIEALGGRLVFVGSGSPAFARDFRAERAPDCTVLSDPVAASYRAIGARHGVISTLSPAMISAALRARRSGARQARVQGRPMQQGGVVVMLPGDRVAWSYISRHAGDHPEPAAVVSALRDAVGRGIAPMPGATAR